MRKTASVISRRRIFILALTWFTAAMLSGWTSDQALAGGTGIAMIAAATPTTSAKIDANGRTVTRVVFGQQGQRLGTYKQTTPGRWEEIPAAKSGNRFQFAETNRDDWSVYLHDSSRDVRLQLDLHRKLVLYSDARTPAPNPLYEILAATVGKADDADGAVAVAPLLPTNAAKNTSPSASAGPVNKMAKDTATVDRMEANGRTVTNVVFGQQGKRLGKYQQSGSARWMEIPTDKSGTRFQFEETGRDDWSVYLHDGSRNVNIQLDLHRKMVLYSDANSPAPHPQYDILAAHSKPVSIADAATAPVPAAPVTQPAQTEAAAAPATQINANGRTATQVVVGAQGQRQGEFNQTGPGQWDEVPAASANRFHFRETGRDDWSVYLHDASRNVRIQIDLYRKQILYADAATASPFPIYDVIAASAIPVPASTPGEPVQGVPQDGFPATGAELTAQGPASGAAGGGSRAGDTKEFCWKDSYGRGAGTVPQSCAPGRERIGLLCYSTCPANSKRFGFDCHSVCPSGMRDDGLFCRAAEYGRGAGYPWEFGDALNDNGMIERCEKDNGKGKCEKDGLIYYPKCKSGYSAVGCCICRPKVPDCAALGMNSGIDLSCAKKVTIGDPVTGTCAAGEEKDGGLCYPKCRAGYTGVGPVCWTGAPRNWVECGMGAAKDSATCGQIVFGQVSSVGQLAFTVATAGAGSAATTAASGATDAARLSKLKQQYQALKAAYKKAEPAMDAAMDAKQAAGVAVNTVEFIEDDKVTEEDIARIAAQIAALADPTGVADTVAAYTYPKCSKYGFPLP